MDLGVQSKRRGALCSRKRGDFVRLSGLGPGSLSYKLLGELIDLLDPQFSLFIHEDNERSLVTLRVTVRHE